MILKTNFRTWRAAVVWLPMLLMFTWIVIIAPFFVDWPRLLETGLIFFWGCFWGGIALLSLFIGFIFWHERWEIQGDQLLHVTPVRTKKFLISQLEAFNQHTLWGGMPSFFFTGIGPMYLVIQKKKVDVLFFPYLYPKVELDAFKAELKNTNPGIEYLPRWL